MQKLIRQVVKKTGWMSRIDTVIDDEYNNSSSRDKTAEDTERKALHISLSKPLMIRKHQHQPLRQYLQSIAQSYTAS